MKTRLHLGCGHILKDGWVHPDPAKPRGRKPMDDNSQTAP